MLVSAENTHLYQLAIKFWPINTMIIYCQVNLQQDAMRGAPARFGRVKIHTILLDVVQKLI